MNLTRYAFKYSFFAIVMAFILSGCLGDDIKPLTPGMMAPKATLAMLDGSAREITDHHGKGQIVTFMSSWCPCSNDSVPMMKKAYKFHGVNKHVEFVLVGIQDSREKFEAVVKKWQLPFAAAFDANNEIARTYGVKQPPTTVFIGEDGKVKRFFYGNIKDVEEKFYKWIEELASSDAG